MQEIPIIDAPKQRFSARMEGRRVTIDLTYLPTPDRWFLNLSMDDQPVLSGVKLVLNVNLMKAVPGLGALFISSEAPGVIPDRQGLIGGKIRLFHASEAEMSA